MSPNIKILLEIYYVFLYSHIRYDNIQWENYPKSFLNIQAAELGNYVYTGR